MNSSSLSAEPLAAPLAIIVLAAGKGTRMKSALPKVLHPIAGQPMLWHVLSAAQALKPARIVVVTGFGAEAVETMVQTSFPKADNISFVRQTEQKGTGHAVLVCQPALADFEGEIICLLGDVMLNARPDVLPTLRQQISKNPAALNLLTADVSNPAGFGRIFHKNNQLVNVEEKDCSEAERKITTANPGIYALPAASMWDMLQELQPNNAQGEYYFTDIIAMSPAHGLTVDALPVKAERPEMGINSRQELAEMEHYFQQGKRKQMMAAGVTLLDPASVYFATDTMIEPDVTIHPHVVFGPGVTVASGAEIFAFCHLAGCTLRKNAHVGPFARLRPTSEVAEDAHVGNFVELKNATLGAHSRAGHLSYLGDVTIGEHTNIGASTVIANYKHKTKEKFKATLGNHVSTGSHTTIVAPATLADGAATGAGTVVREDVAAGTLLVSTPAQQKKPGYNR